MGNNNLVNSSGKLIIGNEENSGSHFLVSWYSPKTHRKLKFIFIICHLVNSSVFYNRFSPTGEAPAQFTPRPCLLAFGERPWPTRPGKIWRARGFCWRRAGGQNPQYPGARAATCEARALAGAGVWCLLLHTPTSVEIGPLGWYFSTSAKTCLHTWWLAVVITTSSHDSLW